ncbi:MAG: 3-dehydroquinate synthase [Phycisphaerales bacterium]|nr:3-dehydroquinate synthase [Phycisphaerales bacterium]
MPDSTTSHSTSLDQRFTLPFVHRVRFTHHVAALTNPTLADVFRDDASAASRRAVLVIDMGLHHARPALAQEIVRYAQAHAAQMPVPSEVLVVHGGERAKCGMQTVDEVLALIERAKICRKSTVFVAGGGAVIDAVGFAAAVAHRGVRLVRIPSTTLAQDDGAMGVKNGINAFGKKNFTGSFAVPWAVVCDAELLRTLPVAVFRAGFSEAVKIALLKDPTFFDNIAARASRIAAHDLDAAQPVIERSAALHLEHIAQGGDPFELHEARPLDFGHWAAHRLEALSAYAVSHGHAVALGLLIDCRYSMLKGWLSPQDFERIQAVLAALHLPQSHPLLAEEAAILEGLEQFREHLGGTLTVTMLRGIGVGHEVHEIDTDLMRQAISMTAACAIA